MLDGKEQVQRVIDRSQHRSRHCDVVIYVPYRYASSDKMTDPEQDCLLPCVLYNSFFSIILILPDDQDCLRRQIFHAFAA